MLVKKGIRGFKVKSVDSCDDACGAVIVCCLLGRPYGLCNPSWGSLEMILSLDKGKLTKHQWWRDRITASNCLKHVYASLTMVLNGLERTFSMLCSTVYLSAWQYGDNWFANTIIFTTSLFAFCCIPLRSYSFSSFWQKSLPISCRLPF